jgi:hypothetical protein
LYRSLRVRFCSRAAIEGGGVAVLEVRSTAAVDLQCIAREDPIAETVCKVVIGVPGVQIGSSRSNAGAEARTATSHTTDSGT